MSRSNASALQAALNANTGKSRSVAMKPAPESKTASAEERQDAPGQGASRIATREGKVNISGYLKKDYRRSLRMVQAVTDKSLETLMAEAYNDLFAKYDVPQVRDD